MGTGDANELGRDLKRLVSTLSPEVTENLELELVQQAADAAQRTGSLLVIAGTAADVGTHVLATDEVVIGRSGSGLVLRDGRISRRHARIFLESGTWMVEDLSSTNGTTLDGVPLHEPVPLANADKIYLGGTVVKFALVDATEAAYLQRTALLAGTDPLTGLHAKHRFDGMLEETLRTCRLVGAPLAVLMMDLDGLKQINDTHGHQAGAETIARVGALIGGLLEGRGEACRFGGDEFCAYVGCDLAEALALAEGIRSAVADCAIPLPSATVRPRISVGVAPCVHPTTCGELVAAADAALYRAKEQGRDRVST